MDKLPQELVDRISGFLSPDDLKNTLLLARPFRFSAEKYSGAFATFNLNDSNAEKFINIFSSHRLLYLRDLVFNDIRLPFPKDRCRRDDADQLSKHDEIFTQKISFLFKTMKTVEETAGTQNIPGRVRLQVGSPHRPVYGMEALTWHDCLSWRVHLLKPDALPLIKSIRSLEVGDLWASRSGRLRGDAGHDWAPVKLDYRVMVDLVVKLPNLEYWGCRMGGGEWSPKTNQAATNHFLQDWAGPRRDTRQDFAKTLLKARLPDSLRRIRLDFLHDLEHSTNIDHLTAQPDLVSPATNDLFSTSLCHLSSHLRQLHLRVVADETLFWPKDGCALSWPNLESFVVMFHMVSPSGQWYFIGPNGEGRDTAACKVNHTSYPPLETTPYDEEMDEQIELEGDGRYRYTSTTRIRFVPNSTTLRPFLMAFAKAASNMRALQEAVLWCPLTWRPDPTDDGLFESDWWSKNYPYEGDYAWGVQYQATSENKFTQDVKDRPSRVPELYWEVGKWRPDPELHRRFQQIGRIQKDNGKEVWGYELSGESLGDQEYFEIRAQERVDQVGRISPPR
jgi:hypothetical protein